MTATTTAARTARQSGLTVVCECGVRHTVQAGTVSVTCKCGTRYGLLDLAYGESVTLTGETRQDRWDAATEEEREAARTWATRTEHIAVEHRPFAALVQVVRVTFGVEVTDEEARKAAKRLGHTIVEDVETGEWMHFGSAAAVGALLSDLREVLA